MKRQVDAGLTDKIPLKPEAVVAYEGMMKEHKRIMLFAQCRTAAWKGKFPLWRAPELLGERLAEIALSQLMQQMIQQQSKIVVPPPQVAVPR